MNTWTDAHYEDGWFVVQVDDAWHVLHRHPIPFESQRDAARAASRLNTRDQLTTDHWAPK